MCTISGYLFSLTVFNAADVLRVKSRWKISNFGIAKNYAAGGKKLLEGTMDQGTEGYQAPEAKVGEYSDKTDIYSYGRVFYELVAGKLPKGGRTSWFREDAFHHPVFGTKLKAGIELMFSVDPKIRPDAFAILKQVNDLIASLNAFLSQT